MVYDVAQFPIVRKALMAFCLAGNILSAFVSLYGKRLTETPTWQS